MTRAWVVVWVGCADPSVGADGAPSEPTPASPAPDLLGSEDPERGPDLWSAVVSRAEAADVVFYGEVTSMSYGEIPAPAGVEGVLPVTFVTWDVLRGIKGGLPGEQVTLQFLGGPAGDGTWMLSSEVPLFDVGETDVVMATDGESACPLVECADGRLRVVDGRVYTHDGHALRVDGRGALRVGVRVALPEALEHDLAGHPLVHQPSQPLSDLPEPDALVLDQLLARHDLPRASFAVGVPR
jgi:hypothetical protein